MINFQKNYLKNIWCPQNYPRIWRIPISSWPSYLAHCGGGEAMVHLEWNYGVKILKYQNYFLWSCPGKECIIFPSVSNHAWCPGTWCITVPWHRATWACNKHLLLSVYTLLTVARFSYTVFIKLSFMVGGQHHTLLWLNATTLYVR